MQVLTINMPGRDLEIRLDDPTFDQFRGAMLAGETNSGRMDKLAAGNFFLLACVVGEDRDKLEEVKADAKAHAAAAFEASALLFVYNAELKKK